MTHKPCPDCGKEMEQGRLYGQAPLLWSPAETKRLLVAKQGDVQILQGHFPAAWICKACHKLIVAY